MDIEMVARNIQLILAPVVMVTSCAILLGGLLGRYATINDRLRAMSRERLDLWCAGANQDAFHAERLREIDAQMPDLLRRQKLVHNSVLAIFSAILIFVASMFVIAFAAGAGAAGIATAALLLFLAGTGVQMLSVALAGLEIRTSHLAVHYEVQRVSSLGHVDGP